MPRKKKEEAFARDLPAYVHRIRSLREDHDLSQTAVAQLLHVAQRTYSDYELGVIRIPVDSLIALAKFYNTDMNYICGISKSVRPYPDC